MPTRWQEIAQALRERIHAGDLPVGVPLEAFTGSPASRSLLPARRYVHIASLRRAGRTTMEVTT